LKPVPLYKLLQVADWLTIGSVLILAGLVVAANGFVGYWWIIAPAHIAAAALCVWLIRLHDKNRKPVTRFIRYFYPVAAIPLIFTELGYLVPCVNSVTVERNFNYALMEIDRALFGCHPTVELEKMATPILTDILQLCYVSYYILPLVPTGILYAKKRFREFRIAAAVILAAYFTSYAGYFLVPATPPRLVPEIIACHAKSDVEGFVLTPVIRPVIDALEPISYDCFPSGHTEVAVAALILAAIFTRRAFWILLPVVAGLVFSTVYLRYHYVIDVAAGLALAGIVLLAVPPIVSRVERMRAGVWEPFDAGNENY
jgi:membrane-associated phospholipid phosphatase